jgi:hypothetical protein
MTRIVGFVGKNEALVPVLAKRSLGRNLAITKKKVQRLMVFAFQEFGLEFRSGSKHQRNSLSAIPRLY